MKMSAFVGMSLVLLLLTPGFLFVPVHAWSPFNCGQVKEWTVKDEDAVEAMQKFQSWVYSWQEDCDRNVYAEIPINGEFGYSLHSAAMNLITAIELGVVYRPSGSKGILQWIWADDDASRCSLKIRSVDCFFEPLSTCSMNEYINQNVVRTPSDPPLSKSERNTVRWYAAAGDVCSIARVFQKPIQWVHGQQLHYVLRANKELLEFIKDRVESIYGEGVSIPGDVTYADNFAKFKTEDRVRRFGAVTHRRSLRSSSSGSNSDANTTLVTTAEERRGLSGLTDGSGSIIGLHIAADTVLEQEAVFHSADLDLAPFIAAVDVKAAELAAAGRPVQIVYICTDHQDQVLHSEETINAYYPRPFKFRMLPHTAPDSSGNLKVLDLELKKRTTFPPSSIPDNRAVVMEYLADIEILALSDVFIGSHSYFYSVVSALRIARYYDLKSIHQRTCLVDRDTNLFCEHDQRTHDLWIDYFKGYEFGSTF